MEIRLLLEKYKNLGFAQNKIKEITIRVCNQFALHIEPVDVDVKEFEVFIRVSGVRKVEYVLLKSKIQEVLLLEFEKEGFKIKEIK